MQIVIKNFYMFCFLVLLVTGCDKNRSMQSGLQRNLAHNDVIFITKTLLENHPGPKNLQDPEFMKILDAANKEAIADAEKVSSEKEHIDLLKKYVRHFNDEHLRISINSQYANIAETPIQIKDFSVREFMPGVIWVTLPTFDLMDQGQVKNFYDIIAQMPRFRDKRLIIFDVRGNGGGNSQWGTKIIEALFGKEYIKKRIADLEQNVYVEWRVSQGNIEFIHSLIDKYKKQFGEQSKEVKWASNLYNEMICALKKDVSFYAEYSDDVFESPLGVTSAPQNMCFAKIIVLIDKGCFSACLGFLDKLKTLDHPVLFVGQTTGVDTLYMDINGAELPSKLGQIQFPMKVYRNRRRVGNQPHYPDIVYPGDFNDTQAVERWLKQNIVDKFLSAELHYS
jgi:hypothetical protein